jgi:uncharacterized repeat protein (TIGR03843 family)
VTRDDTLGLLARGTLHLEGRLLIASNATFLGEVTLDGVSTACVYKPVRGERPLWDFPDGTLAAREAAAYDVSVASGWNLVPETVLRDGPLGPGMCQRWVEADADRELIDLVPADEVGAGWLTVLEGRDDRGRAVALVHADDPALQEMAVFDAIVNNADRKGSHILATPDGPTLGVDHGVCFHVDDKLRTVLWGWAGTEIPDGLLETVRSLAADAQSGGLGSRLTELLSRRERRALCDRLERVVASGRFPLPSPGWPAIPWPAF